MTIKDRNLKLFVPLTDLEMSQRKSLNNCNNNKFNKKLDLDRMIEIRD